MHTWQLYKVSMVPKHFIFCPKLLLLLAFPFSLCLYLIRVSLFLFLNNNHENNYQINKEG